MTTIKIQATKKYGTWLAKHLSKEHPKTKGKIKINGIRYALLGLMVILCLNIASAALFDVKGTVDSKLQPIIIGEKEVAYNSIWETYPPVEIKGLLGLGETKFRGAIVERTDSCSNNCKDIININIAQDSALVDDIKFYTLYGTTRVDESINSFQLYIQEGESWIPYRLGQVMKAGDYVLKITGDKNPDKKVDWVISTQGKNLEEWASWDAVYIGEWPSGLAGFSASLGARGGASVKSGIKIIMNQDRTLLNVSIQPDATGYNAIDILNSGKTIIATADSISGSTAFFNSGFALSAGNTYYISARNTAGNFNSYGNATNVLPYSNPIFNWTGGLVNDGDSATSVEMIYQLTFSPLGGVSLDAPANGTTITSKIVQFNCSASQTGSTLKNVSIEHDLGGSFQIAQTNTTALNGQSVSFNLNDLLSINSQVHVRCSACAVDNTCSNSSSNTYNIANLVNAVSYNATTYETAQESFILNISDSVNIPSATLVYNGTSYTTTRTGSNPYIFSSNINIPTGSGSKSFYWNITSGSNNLVSSTYSQTVNSLQFALCNSTISVPYINFTFKNESVTQPVTNGAISSTWTYYLVSSSVSKSYSFANTSVNPSYAFCSNYPSATLYAAPSISYYNPSSITRSYVPGTLTLTNSTTNTVLWQLATDIAYPVSFLTLNQAKQSILGATITATLSGYGVVETKTTDDSGIATFYLNPLNNYIITASKTGYSDVSSSITPTQTQYTITFVGSSGATSNDYTQGISYMVKPSLGTDLENDTTYSFNFTINSTFWNIDMFGLNVGNGSTIFSSASSGTNGGTVNVNVNTGKNATLYLNYYYLINNTYNNGTVQYIVTDYYGRAWSLKTWLIDFRNYVVPSDGSKGIFGLTQFALNIFVFFIIFTLTGVISYQTGLVSPAAISGVMFFLVLLFDAFLGLISRVTLGTIQLPVATIFIGLVFVGLIWKESTQ